MKDLDHLDNTGDMIMDNTNTNNKLIITTGSTSPTFVIEEYDSNRFDSNFSNINDENSNNIKTISTYNKNIIRHQNFDENPFKYLTEPHPERRVKHGSIYSTSSSRSKTSILKPSSSHRSDDDNISIGACSIGNIADVTAPPEDRSHLINERLIKFLSIIYGLAILVIGVMISLADIENPVNDRDHLYDIIVTVSGMIWVGFIHWDIQKYKRWAMEYLKPDKQLLRETLSSQSGSDYDAMSVTTAVIFNNYNKPIDSTDPEIAKQLSAYRFSKGKHSGNFYLKIGMTIFCMGSIIHQGVNLAQQIHYYNSNQIKCSNAISLVVYLMRCLSAFYYLYFAFKYSNIIIHRYNIVARFALMHLVGGALSFWFSTIIEEAIEGYVKKIKGTLNGTSEVGNEVVFKEAVDHMIYCSENSLSNAAALDAMPYLYPFSIEFDIILASVWYTIWTQIGQKDHNSSWQQKEDLAVNYSSSLTINADCHASNLGLFGGLSALLLIMITIVIFFTTIFQQEHHHIGVAIYTAQFALLVLFSAITIPLAYRKTRHLDIVSDHHLDNSATALDDFLILIPLPFYYCYHILCLIAEANVFSANSLILIFTYLLNIIQVTIQSPFIVDGIRRCANQKKHRFHKPGRGLVTFALMLNIGSWILMTFEIKSVDKYHPMQKFYGKFIWMIISDTCLPLILFYRFHSSVCLSDIWKHAYEKDEHN